MTVNEPHLRVEGVLEHVSVVCDFVVEQAREVGLDERAIHHIYLAVDEACTNIVEHGYGLNCDVCLIDVWVEHDATALTITIEDDSAVFDPLSRPDPDPNAPLNERHAGGWGIFFIKKLMDSVIYSHVGNRNRLVLVKKITKQQSARERREEAAVRRTIETAALPENVWQITPSGRLDEMQAERLALLLNGELAAGHRWLVVNMSEVDSISSAGLKTLVSIWQRTRDQKGELALAALKPRVREVLEMIGLDLVFKISPTPDQARSYLASKSR
jgi:anti-anti-sigma factor